MATQQPQNESPHIPLYATLENRGESTAFDSRLVNGYTEQVEGEWWAYKRPGIAIDTTLTGAGLGITNWRGDIYSVFSTTLYKNGVSIGTVNADTPYSFNFNLGAVPRLFLHNDTNGYSYDSTNGLVALGGGYPVITVPGSAYLDGTMYVMGTEANITGSNINDLSTWGALNSIIAQMEPDNGIYLAKQLAYVVAMKKWTTEFFFDAGNPVGSPLGAAQGAQVTYGCRIAGSVQLVEGAIIWISATRSGTIGVHKLEGVKVEQISTPAIERLLQQADYTTCWSWNMRINGHKFYGVTLKNSNITLVYDVVTRVWSQWTDTNGNYWPFVSSTFNENRQCLLQHEANGNIYIVSPLFYTDDTVSIPFDLYTANYDAGERTNKTLIRMDFITDQSGLSNMFVRVSDDDYSTWSNFRIVDLGKKRPNLRDCGTFRKRAWHFHYVANTPLRIKKVLLQILGGSS